MELITENPMLGVTVKQPKSGRREAWTEEQFNFAYDNCSDPQLKLLISLMIALSSRIGECLALTWSDVYDNEDKHKPSYIRVYKQLVYRSEKFIEETNGRGILKVFDQVRSTRPDAKRQAVFHVTKTEKEIEANVKRYLFCENRRIPCERNPPVSDSMILCALHSKWVLFWNMMSEITVSALAP